MRHTRRLATTLSIELGLVWTAWAVNAVLTTRGFNWGLWGAGLLTAAALGGAAIGTRFGGSGGGLHKGWALVLLAVWISAVAAAVVTGIAGPVFMQALVLAETLVVGSSRASASGLGSVVTGIVGVLGGASLTVAALCAVAGAWRAQGLSLPERTWISVLASIAFAPALIVLGESAGVISERTASLGLSPEASWLWGFQVVPFVIMHSVASTIVSRLLERERAFEE